jgi:hypothetical protein
MATATLTRAEFLKAAERSTFAQSTTLLARWALAAGDTSQSSTLDAEAAATSEATRQLALMAPALAEDTVRLEGVWFDLEGETVALDYRIPDGTGAWFGGATSVAMLVTKASIDLAAGTTTIEGFVAL